MAAVVLLAAVSAPTAFALGGFGDTFGELLGGDFGDILNEFLGGGRTNNGQNGFSLSDLLQNPGGILDTLRERLADLNIDASNSTIAEALMALLNGNSISDLRSLVNSNDFINRLAEYIEQQQATTTQPTSTSPSTTLETPTTEPTTTRSSVYNDDLDVPSIVIPSATYTYSYQGAQTYTTATSASTTETTTAPSYSYVEPSVSYTNPLTTVAFTPVYEDNNGTEKTGGGVKLAIGIGVLLLSAGAIVAVVIMLKKNKA